MQRPFKPVSTAVKRGPGYMWELMRAAGSMGFTAHDIEKGMSAGSASTVKAYILGCVAQGYVERMGIGPRQPAGHFGRRRYRIVVYPGKAPVLRRADYTGERGKARTQLWNGMRAMPAFGIAELAVAASTEDVQVTFGNARKYVAALQRAGLIIAMQPYRKGGKGRAPGAQAGTYRLKPGAKTGPLPPKEMANGVFDPNTETLIPYVTERAAA